MVAWTTAGAPGKPLNPKRSPRKLHESSERAGTSKGTIIILHFVQSSLLSRHKHTRPRPRTEAQGSSPVVPDSTRLTPDNALKMGGLAGAARQPPFLPRPLAQPSANPRSGACSPPTPPRPLAAPTRERWAEGQPAA